MIENKKDLYAYLKADKEALFPNNARGFHFFDHIWQYQKLLRKCEYLRNTSKVNPYFNPLYIINKLRLRRLALRLGFSISENCFGPGLSIAHYGSIVVNSKARIGTNCRIHSCVNIGAGKTENDVPTIGNNVYIGPGAKIFGKITIGDNTKIGANAVVNKDFPGGGTLVGIPATPIEKSGEKSKGE